MKQLHCPLCDSAKWSAIEEIQSISPCQIEMTDDGQVEIELDPMGEFMKMSGTAVLTTYICGFCGHKLEPASLSDLTEFFKDAPEKS